MKSARFLVITLLLSLPAICRSQSLEKGFSDPPMSFRPYAMWYWMGSNYTYAAVNEELEGMCEEGLGGAVVFNVSSMPLDAEASISNSFNDWQTYRSPAYWETLKFACAEGKRLGLEIGLHNCPGNSSMGGPWVDSPSKGMQRLMSVDTLVDGGRILLFRMGRPAGENYHDIAVIAMKEGKEGRGVDLTEDCRGGVIDWDAPQGKWRIFRIGYTCTMSRPHPVTDELRGKTLEVNRMDSILVDSHWDNVLDPLRERLGASVGREMGQILVGAYDGAEQDWTRGFRKEFRTAMGYDPFPWLPYAMDPSLESPLGDRFRHDLEHMVSVVVRRSCNRVSRDRVKEAGMEYCPEPSGNVLSAIAGAADADMPLGKSYSGGDGSIRVEVSAGARAAGHTLIGAEAYISAPENSRFTEDPASLKPATEEAFASGANRLYLHQWAMQWVREDSDRWKPGFTMGWWGTHFGRHQTWFEPGKAFFHYLGRAQYLLQQGEQVIDHLSVDSVPDRVTDAMLTEDLLDMDIRVRDGRVVLPSGREYLTLEFPESKGMLPEVLDRISALVEAGAVVVASRPSVSAGLKDYPACDGAVAIKADDLWKKYYGKRIFPTREEAMKAMGLSPDYTSEENIAVVHRRCPEADIFYVANLSSTARETTVSLRISGLLPEIWNAENGFTRAASQWRSVGDRTEVSLRLEPWQSRFIVLRRKPYDRENALEKIAGPEPELVDRKEIDSGWDVRFRPAYDDPEFVLSGTGIGDFSSSDDERVRYFAGTAVYTRSLEMKAKPRKAVLDLGEMNDIAVLKVNGECVDTLWYPPYRRDISRFVRSGRNTIEVAVTVNWANRLIGDEQYPADFDLGEDRGEKGFAPGRLPKFFKWGDDRPEPRRKAFATWYYWRRDDPLQKAGLAGPVILETSR